MSGDRFGDLGGEERPPEERRTIGERLEERDRTHPEPVERPPEHRRPSTRYAWVVGVAFFIVVVLAAINSLPNEGRSIRGPKAGKQLADFAVPLVTSSLEGDANVRQAKGGSEGAGPVPACEVRSDEVLNSCELTKRPSVITFVFDRGADCQPQVDRVERMRRGLKGVNFAVVYFSRKDRPELRKIVSRRGWTLPVGVDEDGAVANVYGVGGCPTTIFAHAGGKVRRTVLGPITEDALRREIRALRAAS